MSEERTETPDGQVKLLQQPGARPLGGSGTQGRAETGKRIPVLVVRSREWTLWVLAGLTYLGYVAMAAMEAKCSTASSLSESNDTGSPKAARQRMPINLSPIFRGACMISDIS